MSEQESFDKQDDGEPPSAYLTYDKNWVTDESYDVTHGEYYKDHIPMWNLCHVADSIIDARLNKGGTDTPQSYNVLPDDAVSEGSMILRRVYNEHSSNVEGELHREVLYFLVDVESGYCRSWQLSGTQAHWCHNEKRFEPIEDITTRLVENFYLPDKSNAGLARRIGVFVRKLIPN